MGVVDRDFEKWSRQSKNYKIGMCCLSAKHAALRNQVNVSEICCFSELAL